MKVTVVAADIPHPKGTAAGRALWAWCEGARALGHDLEVWAWRKSPNTPEGPLPGWCRFEGFELALGPMWKEHLYSLFRPRMGVGRATWQLPEDRVVIADEAVSSPAVEDLARSATVLHYRAAADALAMRDLRLSVLQDARAERRAGRKPALVLAFSARVARHLRRRAHVVPIAYPLPPGPITLTETPTAVMMADWLWPPNMVALGRLLDVWPSVREKVPGARLLLAGRRMPPDAVGTLAGVELLGPLGQSVEALAQACVMAFPCPATSGPKVKVLEALSYGLPVVTTRHGTEGLWLARGQGAVVANGREFGPALANLLTSPDLRAALSRSGRAAVEAHHAPVPAARARLQPLLEAFGDSR
ncbi:MAG TPA: glycosyltransferase family 4 protein [Acidimicrobiales bacterium]|nr:glycosyltransferase family 4 protein [Acidimicrobiales bacterium]